MVDEKTDTFQVKEKEEEKERKPVVEKKVAKQDQPKPKEDPLAKMTTWEDKHVDLVLKFAHMRPDSNTLGDTILDISNDYSEKVAEKVIAFAWRGLKTGSLLLVRSSFPAKPPVKAERGTVKRYSQYKKR